MCTTLKELERMCTTLKELERLCTTLKELERLCTTLRPVMMLMPVTLRVRRVRRVRRRSLSATRSGRRLGPGAKVGRTGPGPWPQQVHE